MSHNINKEVFYFKEETRLSHYSFEKTFHNLSSKFCGKYSCSFERFFLCEGDNNEFVSSFLSFVYKTIIFGEAKKINTKYNLYLFFLKTFQYLDTVIFATLKTDLSWGSSRSLGPQHVFE